ncbi:MAG: TRAP transporter substrate-binding protein [Pseudomonadales bacterium]|nr:TRAP transporter substrate-binding protein [Pseudomonadales bacterium]
MRTFSKRYRSGLLAAALFVLSACGAAPEQNEDTATAAPQQRYNWKMVTAWPKNFPGLGTAPEYFARKVEAMSGGRMKIRVYGAGELVPALEVFDAVSAGSAEMGHGAAYYWKGKVPEAQFFSALPFGLNGREMDAWIKYGGGGELWRELYAPFNLIPVRGGNTNVQMGGWFNKEINSVEDFRGLKMRIPGLGGEVLQRLGGVSVNLPGGELYTSLQTGVIDATEFTAPYNDLAFGFYDIAKYYYYPGWHEPGAIIEFIFNKQLFEALPADLQEIMLTAAEATNLEMEDEFTARNSGALKELVEKHHVDIRKFPDDLLQALQRISRQVTDELGTISPMAERIHASYRDFEAQVRNYHKISEEAYTKARDLPLNPDP